MKYGHITGLEKPVSRLVQGTVMVHSGDLEGSFKLLDAVFEQGCTAFDTAHIYGGGDNERTVGKWVNSRNIRDKVVILGKGAHHNPDRRRVTPYDITADLHDSLARFQFEYIDLYLLHRDDPTVPVGPIVDILNEHMKAGKIRAFGGSNWSAERIREANDYALRHDLTPFAASSPNYSLADQVEEPWENCVSISGPSGAAQRAWYAQTRLPVFAWSSLAGGFFSGRLTRANLAQHKDALYYRCYVSEDNLKRLDRVQLLAEEKGLTVPQVAMAYVMNQPMNLYALVGCATPEEFADNVDVLDLTLSSEELAWLNVEAESRQAADA